MGLDMFMHECREGPMDTYTLSEFMYWRKEYPIMAWFDERFHNIENCRRYRMTRKDLCDLADWCDKTVKMGNFHQFDEYEYTGWVDMEQFEKYSEEYLEVLKDTSERIREYFNEGKDEGVDYWVFYGWW